ncbi:hypothetical protein O0L34_g9237 [Tuta absoluta]|nr:hypothetical protein O0L34_g9237 [Tuta absoluta]
MDPRTVSLQSTAEAPKGSVTSDNSSNSSQSRGQAQSQSYSAQVENTHMEMNTQSAGMEASLLSTALVEVSDKDGNFHQVRAVLDNCSKKCLVTQSLCDNLQSVQSTIQIRGVGHSVTQSSYRCDMLLRSLDKTFTTHTHCLV